MRICSLRFGNGGGGAASQIARTGPVRAAVPELDGSVPRVSSPEASSDGLVSIEAAKGTGVSVRQEHAVDHTFEQRKRMLSVETSQQKVRRRAKVGDLTGRPLLSCCCCESRLGRREQRQRSLREPLRGVRRVSRGERGGGGGGRGCGCGGGCRCCCCGLLGP